MKKIIHIITDLSDGGAEAVLFRLCMASTQFHHVVVSLTDEGKYGSRLRQYGISVYSLHMPNFPNGKLTISGLWRLWKFLRRERPDLVQTWMYHADLVGGVIASLAGIRNIVWGIHHTNLDPNKSKATTIQIAHICARLSAWIPRRIVFCAQVSSQVHVSIGYEAGRIVVIPNGYDLALFNPDPVTGSVLRQGLGFAGGRPLIGMVARFDSQKDHAGLIEAFSRVLKSGYDSDLALIGNGMNRDNPTLKHWIAAHALSERVHLLGQRDDIPMLMNALDLHVLSSFGEAFPNVLAEAMACGTPCVTTDVGDAAMIVGDTGWVVPPGDPEAFAGAISHALCDLQNPERWAMRKAAARARIAREFSLVSMVNAYEQVWQGCLEG